MRKKLRWAALFGLLLLLVAGGVVGWYYYASQQTPDFYRDALAMDDSVAREASREMVDETAELVNRTRKQGPWQHTFTAQQINGWLAVDRAKNHPNLLPREFADPRIAIEPQSAVIGCMYNGKGIGTVLSLEVDAYMSEPNVLALRIRKAYAGEAPLPLGQVLDAVKKGAANAELALEWRQIDGDPVALITLSPPSESKDHTLRVEKLELRQGEVYLAGRTERRQAPSASSGKLKTADRSGAQVSRQR